MASEPAEPTTRQGPRTRDAVLARVIEEANEQVDDDWTTTDTLAFREYFGERLVTRLAAAGLLADPAQTTELEKLRAQRDAAQSSSNVWKQVAEQWEQGHQNTVLPYTTKLEEQRDALSLLLRGMARRTHRFRLLMNVNYREVCDAKDVIDKALAERDERRARIDEHEDLQLTTEQKNLWADAVEKISERHHPGDGAETDRWWQGERRAVEEADDAAEPACECFVVPEEQWTRHYDATEPGSMVEQNPDCPVHPAKQADDAAGDLP